MKLYYAPGTCSLAPHIALIEIGASFDLERVDTRAKKTERGADFLRINPKGYVPALELDDGEILTEGVVMQQYIADLRPEAKLAPARGTKERRRLEELLAFLSSEIHKSFSPLFAAATPDAYKMQLRERIAQRLDYLEQQFADGRAFLTGGQFTIADAYFFTHTTWAKTTGVDLARWPLVSGFAARVAARPSVQQAMKAEGVL
ncbi:MAG: glutathione transferase GstA [Hyphomonadaceae bacterium]